MKLLEGEELCLECEQLPTMGKQGTTTFHVCCKCLFPAPQEFEKTCMECGEDNKVSDGRKVCSECLPKVLKRIRGER